MATRYNPLVTSQQEVAQRLSYKPQEALLEIAKLEHSERAEERKFNREKYDVLSSKVAMLGRQSLNEQIVKLRDVIAQYKDPTSQEAKKEIENMFFQVQERAGIYSQMKDKYDKAILNADKIPFLDAEKYKYHLAKELEKPIDQINPNLPDELLQGGNLFHTKDAFMSYAKKAYTTTEVITERGKEQVYTTKFGIIPEWHKQAGKGFQTEISVDQANAMLTEDNELYHHWRKVVEEGDRLNVEVLDENGVEIVDELDLEATAEKMREKGYGEKEIKEYLSLDTQEERNAFHIEQYIKAYAPVNQEEQDVENIYNSSERLKGRRPTTADEIRENHQHAVWELVGRLDKHYDPNGTYDDFRQNLLEDLEGLEYTSIIQDNSDTRNISMGFNANGDLVLEYFDDTVIDTDADGEQTDADGKKFEVGIKGATELVIAEKGLIQNAFKRGVLSQDAMDANVMSLAKSIMNGLRSFSKYASSRYLDIKGYKGAGAGAGEPFNWK